MTTWRDFITPAQRAYLDYMSWSLSAQDEVRRNGFNPTPEVAAFLRESADARDHRSHMESCALNYNGVKSE